MAENPKKNAVVSEELASKFKTEKETPYTRWVKAEGLDIIPSFYVKNLNTVALKPWARRDGNAWLILGHMPDSPGRPTLAELLRVLAPLRVTRD